MTRAVITIYFAVGLFIGLVLGFNLAPIPPCGP